MILSQRNFSCSWSRTIVMRRTFFHETNPRIEIIILKGPTKNGSFRDQNKIFNFVIFLTFFLVFVFQLSYRNHYYYLKQFETTFLSSVHHISKIIILILVWNQRTTMFVSKFNKKNNCNVGPLKRANLSTPLLL